VTRFSKRVDQCGQLFGVGLYTPRPHEGSFDRMATRTYKRAETKPMRSKFRLEMDVVVDTDFAADLIETARRSYAAGGPASCVGKDGAHGPIPTEQPIEGIEDALVDLSERNPLLANINVGVEAVGCRCVSEPQTGRSAVEDEEPPRELTESPDEPLENGNTEDDLDEFETGLYSLPLAKRGFLDRKGGRQENRGRALGRMGRCGASLVDTHRHVHDRFSFE
jgi:hypothetical protein